MGTTSSTFVKINNKFVDAQYGKMDGYPEWQGKTILEKLRECDLQDIREGYKSIIKLKKGFVKPIILEWVYIVDFDKNTFEAYENPKDKSRFLQLFSSWKPNPKNLCFSYNLDSLPEVDAFIENCQESIFRPISFVRNWFWIRK